MEKVLEILEKNVQWIVLGLGALFLGWVAYTYVAKPPATVKLGNETVVPDKVDVTTYDGPAKTLEDEIHITKPVDFPTPDLVSSWRSHMQEPKLIRIAFDPWDIHVPPGGGGGTEVLQNKVFVTSLPVLPKAIALTPITGLSVIQLQAPNGNANPAQPAAAPTTADLLWDTAGFTIPGKLLGQAMLAPVKAWVQDPVLPTVYNSALLQVVLQRQKSIGVDANGNPVFPVGDKGVEQVPPLTIYQTILQPLPKDGKDGDDVKTKYGYLDWAQQNYTVIATPAFYTIVAGTVWAPPQNPALGQPVPPVTQPATEPATAPAAPAAPAAAPPASGPKVSAPGAAFRTNASYSVIDPVRTPGPMFPGNIRDMPGAPPGGNFAQPANGGAAGGQINPFVALDDIQIWAHDETVKPGQSYRYRVIYKMKNPVFGVQNMAPDKLVNQLTIVSPPSDWSPAVTVAETTKFWLADIRQLDKPAKMDVAHWKNGAWTLDKNVLVGPGDGVPGTDLTLVDVRIADPKSGREKYVLLVSGMGDLKRHDLAGDVADPDHQAMVNQLNPITPGGAAPTPAPRNRPIPGRGPNGLQGRE